MGGSPPASRPSSGVSMFSENQYTPEEARIPINEQQGSRMRHLAVKDEEWNEPAVLEGLYIASLIYMKQG